MKRAVWGAVLPCVATGLVSFSGRGEGSEEELRQVSGAAAEEQLESLVAQRLLEFDGRAYSCGLRWSAGTLAVNGRPLSPGAR